MKNIKNHIVNENWREWQHESGDETDLRSDAFSIVFIELLKAELKHPVFPEGQSGIAIIAEEFLELVLAENDNSPVNHRLEEAAHVAVTAIRHIENIIKGKERSLRNGD